jgi:hypothetical protein
MVIRPKEIFSFVILTILAALISSYSIKAHSSHPKDIISNKNTIRDADEYNSLVKKDLVDNIKVVIFVNNIYSILFDKYLGRQVYKENKW